jgi:hypothetical protein
MGNCRHEVEFFAAKGGMLAIPKQVSHRRGEWVGSGSFQLPADTAKLVPVDAKPNQRVELISLFPAVHAIFRDVKILPHRSTAPHAGVRDKRGHLPPARPA